MPLRNFLSRIFAVLIVPVAAIAAEPAAESLAWAAFEKKSPPPPAERYATADPLQELEIYPALPAAKGSGAAKPVLILIHGGGWGGGTRDALAPHARYFAALGWTSLNLSYRLTSQPGVTLMNAQEDVRAAFDWVRAQASPRGWDARRIVVLGESATEERGISDDGWRCRGAVINTRIELSRRASRMTP